MIILEVYLSENENKSELNKIVLDIYEYILYIGNRK
jgi:hypothetical protein